MTEDSSLSPTPPEASPLAEQPDSLLEAGATSHQTSDQASSQIANQIASQKKPKPIKFSSRTPLPFDLPYRQYYAKAIPVMQIFRSALLQHYATDSAQHHPLKRGLRRFADLLRNGHSHIAAECGVYQGSSLVACAEIVRQYGLNAHIYGLDSFQGFPEFSNMDEQMAADLVIDLVKEKGTIFDDTSQGQVQAAIDERDLSSYVTLVPGFFSETLPTLPTGPYFFVNIDCDLYEGHLECLEFFYPKVEKGGIIFLDDYYSVHYPMAKTAVDSFMKDRPEDLFHIRYGPKVANYTKTFFVKH